MKMPTVVYTFLFSLCIETVLGLTIKQNELSWTKTEGKSIYIKCEVKGLSGSSYLHWYQQKDGEALKRILYFSRDGGTVPEGNHPEKDDFTVTKDYDLKINSLKKSHSAVYYCASWEGAQ
ncbi:hypothetical protein SRHO_G00021330 [Serrasalmus rhombeus]